MHHCQQKQAASARQAFKIEVMRPDFASVPLALALPAAPRNGVGEAGPHLGEGHFSRPDWRRKMWLWSPHAALLKQ